MPHSLRAKIKGLRYKGIITDKDCDRLCKALDNEGVLDKIRTEIINTLYIDSLMFGELIDFKNGKISADDVIDEFNRVTKLEILKIFNKYMTKNEADEFNNLDSMLEDLWNAGIEDRQYGFIKK